MRQGLVGLILGFFLASGLPIATDELPPRFIYLTDRGLTTVTVDDILTKATAQGAQPVITVPITKTENLSVGGAVIVGSESLHRHQHSDLVVLVWKGKGEMTLGKERLEVRKGDVILVTKGAVHKFENREAGRSVGLAVFSPPAQKGDYIEVTDEK
ncbi:MAG: cupin domain-containing protein [Armatimonadetes bacterium]|nr:cupin domain-containing protein [Armatimonadota bacterium]MDW8120998.1 cupin domain-containing protein [Armatimonadota bacterium]